MELLWNTSCICVNDQQATNEMHFVEEQFEQDTNVEGFPGEYQLDTTFMAAEPMCRIVYERSVFPNRIDESQQFFKGQDLRSRARLLNSILTF